MPAPLNTPILAFLVSARKATSSSSTALSATTPLISWSSSNLPSFSTAAANISMEAPSNTSPAPVEVAFLGLILLTISVNANMRPIIIVNAAIAPPKRSGSICATMYSAPAISAIDAAISSMALAMSPLPPPKDESASVMPSPTSPIVPTSLSLICFRPLINFMIFSTNPAPRMPLSIAAISAPSIFSANPVMLSMIPDNAFRMPERTELPSKNFENISPKLPKLPNHSFSLPSSPSSPLPNRSVIFVLKLRMLSIIPLMTLTIFSTMPAMPPVSFRYWLNCVILSAPLAISSSRLLPSGIRYANIDFTPPQSAEIT